MWKLIVLTLYLGPVNAVVPPGPSTYIIPTVDSGYQSQAICETAKTALLATPIATLYPSQVNAVCVRATTVYVAP